MISLMLSAWSDAAAIIGEAAKRAAREQVLGKNADSAAAIAEHAADAINAIRDRRSHAHDFNNTYIKGIPNMYKLLFQNYKKVKNEDAEKYRDMIADTKDIIGGIKKVFCRQLKNSRQMTAAEIHDIKLFKPEKIAKEMGEAVAYHKEHNPAVYPLADSFAKWWTSNVVGYLSSNLTIA